MWRGQWFCNSWQRSCFLYQWYLGWFKSSANFIENYLLLPVWRKDENKDKEAGKGPLKSICKKEAELWLSCCFWRQWCTIRINIFIFCQKSQKDKNKYKEAKNSPLQTICTSWCDIFGRFIASNTRDYQFVLKCHLDESKCDVNKVHDE